MRQAAALPAALPRRLLGLKLAQLHAGWKPGGIVVSAPRHPAACQPPCHPLPSPGQARYRVDTGQIQCAYLPVPPILGCTCGTDPLSVQLRCSLTKCETPFPHAPSIPPSPSSIPCPARPEQGRQEQEPHPPCQAVQEMLMIQSGCTQDQPTRSAADTKSCSPRSPQVTQPPSSQQPSEIHCSSAGPSPQSLVIPAWSCSDVPMAVPKSPGLTRACTLNPMVRLCCLGTACLSLPHAQKLS